MWKGTTARIPSASLLALPRQFLLLPLHGSVLVAEVQGQSLRVAACDGGVGGGGTALSNTVSLLMFAETSACLVRSLIRVLVCALVSPSHVLGVQFGSWKVVRHCHMHLPSSSCGVRAPTLIPTHSDVPVLPCHLSAF